MKLFSIPDGNGGNGGKTGRFFYYADVYDNTKEYVMEATQAPYVKYTNQQTGAVEFFMFDNKGVEPTTLPYRVTGVAPDAAAQVNPWTKMSSEQQYYIARAFFGENAYLGSFIINGDWMLSQYGTLIDSSGTKTIVDATNANRQYNGKVPYAWFDATDPMAGSNPQSGSYKFTPNFAVDGLTGATYQNKAYIRGEVHATSGEFNGIVKAQAFYAGSTIKDGDYEIDPANGDKSIIIIGGPGETPYVQRIVLPSAKQYDGMILRFFNPYVTMSSTSGLIVASGSDLIYSPGDPYATTETQVYLQRNRVVSYVAIADFYVDSNYNIVSVWLLMG